MALLEEQVERPILRAGISAGIEKRILYLAPADRKLLELTLGGRLSRREAGMLAGRSASTVTRRVMALLRRLNDPLVKGLVETGKLLPELHQEVGLAYFLRWESIRRISVNYDLSEYEVKRMLTYIRGWHGAGRHRR